MSENTKKSLVSVPAVITGLATYLPGLLSFVQANPYWILAFTGAASLYAAYMVVHQEEIDEILVYIKEHPDKFHAEIVNSKEFEKAFILFLDNFFKQRTKQKKSVAKKVFLGYVSNDKKENYEIERLNDCLLRITPKTLEFLAFLKQTIIPLIDEETITEVNQKYQKSDMSAEWWRDQLTTQKSIWLPLDKWIHNTYSPSMQEVKEEYGIKNNEGWIPDLQHRAENRERNKRSEISESVSELVTLGIFDLRIGGSTWGGGGGKDYAFTHFGLKFIKYLEN